MLLRFRAAYLGDYHLELGEGRQSLKKTLITLAGFTFLNPHVYLDTIGLIGAVSAQYDADSLRYAYATGASLGSLVFFCAWDSAPDSWRRLWGPARPGGFWIF